MALHDLNRLQRPDLELLCLLVLVVVVVGLPHARTTISIQLDPAFSIQHP